MNPLIVIPARLQSVRLPNKPLADIAGLPMIVQVMRRAEESGVGPVVIAAAEQDIVDAVEVAGGTAVLTDPDHPSGSDRVWEAVQKTDPNGEHDVIVNVQGDLPTMNPKDVQDALIALGQTKADLSTLVAEIKEDQERTNPNVVKAIVAWEGHGDRPLDDGAGQALYFTRATAPTGDGPLWHHIGLYAYRRAALERFVSLSPSALEKREKLEQLRALENGMTIGVAAVASVPLGVDTEADLLKARAALEGKA